MENPAFQPGRIFSFVSLTDQEAQEILWLRLNKKNPPGKSNCPWREIFLLLVKGEFYLGSAEKPVFY